MANNSNTVNLNICYGCMKPVPQNRNVCPLCGYNCVIRQNPDSALPEGTVLNGKYLVGKSIDKSLEAITYLGFDLFLKSAVEIREYFPVSLASRAHPSYDVQWKMQEGSKPEEKCKSYIKNTTLAIKTYSAVDSAKGYFYEHNTAYVVTDHKAATAAAKPNVTQKTSQEQPQPPVKVAPVAQRAGAFPVKPVTQKKKKSKAPLIFLLAAVIAILAVIAIPVSRGYKNLDAADQALASGNYEEASRLYSKIRNNLVCGSRAEEGYHSANVLLAEKAVQSGEYLKAMDIYESLGDEEGVRKAGKDGAAKAVAEGDYLAAVDIYERLGNVEQANIAWNAYGITQLEARNYEEAIRAFQTCGDEKNEQKSRIAWGDALLKKSDYDGAITQYNLVGEVDKAKEATIKKAEALIADGKGADVPILLQDYSGVQIAKTVFNAMRVQTKGMTQSKINEQAALFGKYITDTDTQLEYCRLLWDSGYSLKEVYPNGVEVDADLAKFQLFEMNAAKTNEKPNTNKVLFFSREDERPDLEGKSVSSELEIDQCIDNVETARKTSEYKYVVKLLPGMIESLSKDKQV